MAFKPHANLLNVNFEGYKLSKDALPCVSRPFSPGVRVARLKDEDFSFQHMRAFSLHNHLVVDPWDDTSVYWYAEDGTIQRAKYEVDTGVLTIRPVFSSNTPNTSSGNYVNASLCFSSETLCVFSNGQGNLQFLYTGDRTSTSTSWKSWDVEESLLGELTGSNFVILAAALSSDGLQLNLATTELKDPSQLKRTTKEMKPMVAVYRWHRVKFTIDVNTQLSQFGDEPGNLIESIALYCTFQSCAIPLYCNFSTSNLLMISESDIYPVDLQKQESSPNMHVEPPEEEHQGLGYLKENTYTWNQSDTDISVTVHLPEDVKKEDISCIIERNSIVVGLTDGTTYLRGKLCATIDTEASTWSNEKHVLEVTLEKKEPGRWPSLWEGGEEEEGGHQAQGLSQEQLSKSSEEMTESSEKPEGDGPSSPKKPRLVQDVVEECDMTEDATLFFVLDEDGNIIKRGGLGGHNLLFTAPSSNGGLPLLCLRYDVDAIVWQPLITTLPSDVAWNHLGTFNALGYIQAAKTDKKFSTCPPSLDFAAITDCNRHVFVYQQPAEGVKGNTALQYVHTIASEVEILGLQASSKGLVFVLCEKEMLVLLVK